MALSETAKEAIFFRELWSEICNKEITIPILSDNRGALAIAKNPDNNDRTKHIDIRVHFIRERVESKELIQCTETYDFVDSLGLC
jgi:hypothetical protein